MPNGFQGSASEWGRMEAPLISADPALEEFARAHQLAITKNYHGWPEGSLTWNDNTICRRIQIYLTDANDLAFSVWLCAWEDRGARYLKSQYLIEGKSLEQISPELASILREGYAIVNSWSREQLQRI
jgi:hypothetical protein